MKLFFKNLKPVSTNCIYKGMGKNRSKVKEYKYMEQVCKFKLIKHGREIQSFCDGFDPGTGHLKVELVFYVPKTKLFTKKGDISKISGDLDNYQKSIIDSIFNCIDLDDAYIGEIVAKKRASNDSQYHISFKMEKAEIGELEEPFESELEYGFDEEG